MGEQILITYTKTDETFIISIINGKQRKSFTTETPEAVELVNKIKEVLKDVD